jgi:hypothetical protein
MMEPTPLRPDEQVAGGFLVVSLGGKPHQLAVLNMAANRKWTAHLAEVMREVLGNVGPIESADQVADLLAKQAETMMDLLIAYDAAGDSVLPDREWIDTHATDTECYQAMKRVTAAAYPFGPDLLRIVPELIPSLAASLSKGVAAGMIAIASSRAMSSSPRSTAGAQPISSPTSPTSSSPSMPSTPRSGAKRKPSVN